jgi:glycine hydroxymethyltransferase
MLVDVKGSAGQTGKEAEERLDAVNITANKNTIPFDDEKPFIASGIRLGTPALTTRGFKEPQMRQTANLIADALLKDDTEETRAAVIGGVKELADTHPLYRELREWLKPVEMGEG